MKVQIENKKPMSREAAMQVQLTKENELRNALRTPAGLAKIAANLGNPVRKHLDYEGIFRKFCVVEQWPDGQPIIYDDDIEEFTATTIAKNGTVRRIDIETTRVELEPFQIVVRPKIPYQELYSRLYNIMNRTKERLIQGMQLREDNYGFGLIETASTLTHSAVTIGTALTRDALAKSFSPIEFTRNVVASVLMTAYGIQGIRRFQFQDLDQMAMEEVRKSGYLGSMWGAKFFISDQIPAGRFYPLGTPDKLAWFAIRRDSTVLPNDDPDNLLLGFTGWQLQAITLHNSRAVVQGNFDYTA